MPDPNINELNSLTYYEVYPKTIEDEFFLAAPFLAYLRDHCLVPFTGGSFMQAIFRYAPLIGGFYAPGGGFNITRRQTIAALQFDTRYLYVSIFCGNSATGAAGPITYSTLEEAYQDATIGRKEPNLGVGNKAVIAYIKEKLVVQQRFAQERDPVWGVTGFRLNNAMI